MVEKFYRLLCSAAYPSFASWKQSYGIRMNKLSSEIIEEQPRTIGVLGLRLGCNSQLEDLYQEGASKALFARKRTGAEAILINTSGGITGGDSLKGDFETTDDACLCVTTQGFERVYKSRDKSSGVVKNTITVRDNSSFHWLPQETLFYDGGHLDRNLTVNASSDATTLIVEPMLFGRLAMGEDKLFGRLRDRISLSIDGELCFQDSTEFVGSITNILNRPTVMAGARATALVILSSHRASAVLPKILPLLNDTSGASLINRRLLVSRLIAHEGMALRQMLIPIINEITQIGIPKTWRL